MAATKSHRYLGGGGGRLYLDSPDDEFELEEAEVWSTNQIVSISPETRKQVSYHPRSVRKPWRKSVNVDRLPVGPKSLPVNIPDWSRILGGEYRRRAGGCEDDEEEEEEEEGNERIPPHEYLARSRVASFSVHEGVGRTLKGRDLSRVRNAIWKQTGFED
ncbi:hypothetical protein Salat_1006800 [Sesamum alatum]|uniref:Senescence regulator n=1 Tax=Sesamum alatum TaxID=300844 RepID=A0AAE1YLX0_9LAMI|nr:hypothetical protein Salat_1006800 [Sesamum alatum]